MVNYSISILGLTILSSCASSLFAFSTPFHTSTTAFSNTFFQKPVSYNTPTSQLNAQSFPVRFDESNTDDDSSTDVDSSQLPQVFATGYSQNPDLLLAITEAVTKAVLNLPPPPPHLAKNDNQIDVAFLTISSLYDNQSIPMTTVVPTLLTTAMNLYGTVKNVVGSTAGGVISWKEGEGIESEDGETDNVTNKNVEIVESEGALGVSVTLALLPDVELQAFHVEEEDVPDDVGRVPTKVWKSAVNLSEWDLENDSDEGANGDGAFFLLPSPSFQPTIDDLLEGFKYNYPKATVFGGLASTVSSLSRARLFLYKDGDSTADPTVYMSGCIGLGLKGDIQVQTLVAQGAKPVGGVYRIVDGEESTIRIIVADEESQSALSSDDEDNEEELDEKAKWKAMYAKALVPKPPLAEANQIIKILSDDNANFMRKAILIGLEKGGSLGRTPNELLRLQKGEGHSYLVRQVASAGMKDGSVTMPLESVKVENGGRMRFFVREGEWCKKEIQAIWSGYKTLQESESQSPCTPSACFMISTMDRGSKLFGSGKGSVNKERGFEGNEVLKSLPSVNSISGFYGNGVLAGLDGSFNDPNMDDEVMLHGSASCYAIIGSKTNRPVFNAAARKTEKSNLKTEKSADSDESNGASPRKENGELLLKRREVHSGRALTVSTVEWSVAEKSAKPTSVLEGYMWDKETEVDRLRERVPLPNLLSQVKLAMADPTKPKPRDWISKVKEMEENNFIIVPECKRSEVGGGSLRERYDVSTLARQYVKEGDAKALSVNCDAVLFGGALEDIETVRKTCGEDVPILASDLLLYPYQLYKLRLAGADAVYLVAAALEGKDFLYLAKIANSLNLQTVVTVTSEVQIQTLTDLLSPGNVNCLVLSNRDLETFSFDESGEQALNLLTSTALDSFKEKHGNDVLILVEGRVGVGDLGQSYINDLKDAGANGAIIGQGMAEINGENGGQALKSFNKEATILE